MALLDIRNLRIDIQTPNGLIRIVDNVSFTIDEGEICGLVGESGSGKSLIAKVICNAFKDSWIVTADRFRFNDVELLKLTPAQRRKLVGKEISMVFQDPLTCLDPSQKIGKQLIQSIPGWTFKGRNVYLIGKNVVPLNYCIVSESKNIKISCAVTLMN